MRIRFLPLLALISLAGCQTPHVFQMPEDHWVTRHGQLRHTAADGTSVIGEVVVSYVPVGQFQLDYMAGPGFPLLKLREDPQRASAFGSLARGRWEGRPHTSPPRLENWFRLHEVFNRLAARRWAGGSTSVESLTPGLWRATVNGHHGRPARVTVVFPRTRERFEFVFQVPDQER